jgi:hypothetical protein
MVPKKLEDSDDPKSNSDVSTTTYLFIELRQRLLGTLLGRHGEDCRGLKAVMQKLKIEPRGRGRSFRAVVLVLMFLWR